MSNTTKDYFFVQYVHKNSNFSWMSYQLILFNYVTRKFHKRNLNFYVMTRKKIIPHISKKKSINTKKLLLLVVTQATVFLLYYFIIILCLNHKFLFDSIDKALFFSQ